MTGPMQGLKRLVLVWALAALTLVGANAARAQLPSACEVQHHQLALQTGTVAYVEIKTVAQDNPLTVLMLHGLFAQKEQWLELACQLSLKGWRVVAMDLPGFGQSSGFFISDHRLKRQATLVTEFIKRVASEPVHLAGNSMGGAIAALVAQQSSPWVRSLALIGGPMGIVTWAGPLQTSLDRGENPFVPESEALVDLEMSLLFAKPPAIDAATKQAMAAHHRDHLARHLAIWHTVTQDALVLKSTSASRVPTLIVWGDADHVFEIGAVPAVQTLLPNNRFWPLAGVGHLPMLEAPSVVAELYIEFLKQQGGMSR